MVATSSYFQFFGNISFSAYETGVTCLRCGCTKTDFTCFPSVPANSWFRQHMALQAEVSLQRGNCSLTKTDRILKPTEILVKCLTF